MFVREKKTIFQLSLEFVSVFFRRQGSSNLTKLYLRVYYDMTELSADVLNICTESGARGGGKDYQNERRGRWLVKTFAYNMLINKWISTIVFQCLVNQCPIIYNYYVICGDHWQLHLNINSKAIYTYLQQRLGAEIALLIPVCLDSKQFESPPLLLLLFVCEQ